MPTSFAASGFRHRVPLLLALGVFALHAALFWGWIVDDAGITFAYARNLAQGHGLVAQAGAAPVEGYSNPLWTLVVAALYALGVFQIPWTPKLVACAAIVLVLVLVWRDLRSRASNLTTALALGLLASCSAFVIWTTSGLENALLAALAAYACVLGLRAPGPEMPPPSDAVRAGVVAALMALTRPDALLYVAAYPAALLVGAWSRRRLDLGGLVVRGGWMALGFLPLFGGYLAFRVAYFGEWVPNTFFAKVRPSGSSLLDPGKLLDLVEAATGDALFPVLVLVAAALGLLALRARLHARTIVLGVYLAIATTTYMVMPADWMGEFRFATPFFLFFYWFLADVAASIGDVFAPSPLLRRMAAAAALVFAVQAAIIFAARSLSFAGDPTVPLAVAARFGGEGFNALAAHVHVPNPSLLTPDLGGVLLESRLRVFDLAGLCDKTIARTLYSDPRRMREYVFGEVKPTFIHTQGAFTRASRLHEDPRLETDYVPLHEARSAPSEWRAMWRGSDPPPWWGDYVRRDALAPGDGTLAALRDVYAREALGAYEPWKRPPDRLRSGWPQVAWALSTLREALGRGGAPGPAVRPAG